MIFISVPTVLAATTNEGINEFSNGGIVLGSSYTSILSLQVDGGSSPENIKVNPELTNGTGSKLSTSLVEIYVNGNYSTKVSSNQWSGDIWVGLGNHTIKASAPEITDPSDSLVKYPNSTHTVNWDGIIEETFPIEYIIILVIAAIVATSAAILYLKKSRKSKISKQAGSRPKFCRKCGSPLTEKDKFCGKCGKPLLLKQ